MALSNTAKHMALPPTHDGVRDKTEEQLEKSRPVPQMLQLSLENIENSGRRTGVDKFPRLRCLVWSCHGLLILGASPAW